MKNALVDRLEIWGFEDDFIIFSDGSMGFGLEAIPIDVSCWDDDRTNGIAERASSFINGLPTGVDIQFVQDIASGNSTTIEEHAKISDPAANEAAKSLTEERVQRLRELDKAGSIPKHTLKIFVRRPLGSALLDKPKFFSKQRQFQEIAQAKFERELNHTERLRTEIIQGLSSLGLDVSPLKTSQIVDLIYWQWNPARPVERAGYDPEDVRSSLLFTDVAISERDFALSDIHHRIVSLKILPDQTFASMAAALRDLPFDSRLFLSMHVPDQVKELESLQTQRRLAFAMARGKKSGVSDIESENKFQDLESLLDQMIAQGERVFNVSLNVLLRSNSQENLETQVAQTLTVFRELSSAEGMEESIATFDIFSELAIPNARAKERAKRVKTSNLCDLLPVFGPWRGFQRPSILLRTRMGSLFSFDPFGETVNANQLISGGSGSGKSFLTNLLLLQMLRENPKVFFVDIGGSYKKLCENLNGQYVPLGVDNGLSLNPFDLDDGATTPSSEKIKFLVGLIELISKEENAERLPKFERAIIEELICQTYEKCKLQPRLSDLRELFLSHPEISIKRIGRILTSWCGDTPFGRFIDRPTNIELKNPIVAWDLKGVEPYPELQAACLYMITEFIWRAAQRDRYTKKFLVFDECWQLLKDDAGCALIESIYRTGRKYFLSAISLSQAISDFSNSKIASAIIPNCSIKWILMQNQSDPKPLKEVLGLNSKEIGIISSLTQMKGVYSEAFLMAERQRSAVVIECTPLEYWIATTDPRDLGQLEKYTQENPTKSNIQCLKELSERYPQGIAAYESEQRSKVL